MITREITIKTKDVFIGSCWLMDIQQSHIRNYLEYPKYVAILRMYIL